MMPETLRPLLDSSVRAAREAGAMLAGRFGAAAVVSQSNRDVKLGEDRASQDMIVARLVADTGLPVLTEESGWIGTPPADDGLYFVVDPLDGSFNFLAGIPLCCVSIAVCAGATPVAGCVYDFLRDEIHLGGDGLGLSINGHAVATGGADRRIFATGFPAGGAHSTAALTRSVAEWRKIRMLGTAALSLAWVAAGRLDGYGENGIRWWDVAGGLALVRAAGGRIAVNDDADRPLAGHAGIGEALLNVTASRI